MTRIIPAIQFLNKLDFNVWIAFETMVTYRGHSCHFNSLWGEIEWVGFKSYLNYTIEISNDWQMFRKIEKRDYYELD